MHSRQAHIFDLIREFVIKSKNELYSVIAVTGAWKISAIIFVQSATKKKIYPLLLSPLKLLGV